MRGSSTRDKLIIRFAVIDWSMQTDRNSGRTCNDHTCAKKLNIHGQTVNRGKKDVNVFDRRVKGQCQYAVTSFLKNFTSFSLIGWIL